MQWIQCGFHEHMTMLIFSVDLCHYFGDAIHIWDPIIRLSYQCWLKLSLDMPLSPTVYSLYWAKHLIPVAEQTI